ncbi:monooxygenase [Microbacterium sp. SORGH_AS_0888]|uniref:monooxygenase n=1 Tax=Microbacterium sp. SORGH_AS_0888 TaxID=3041791 RepID=UPI00278B4B51|nr:monooxygenase [Microbacterium sp. SORGH_AS_0888]MDQ1131338.1 alkylation response protein AidB-like acyl-CoA dehydrogenase [Microbacterium sp. SORGH_AS_0888]
MTDFTDTLFSRLPDDIVERFRPVLERISLGTVDREVNRVLPAAELALLREAGLPLARLPREEGGLGLDWPTFGRLLIAVAAADSNLPQILRGHIALVEQVLTVPDAAFRRRWTDRIVGGEIAGNSWSEPSGSTTARSSTELVADPDGTLRITGRKFYTTGSIFAEWTDTVAHRLSDDTEVTALVRLDQPGVEVRDDWDGFGQKLTGTGTIVFDGAVVEPGDVLPVAERFGYQTALYQFLLLAVLAGVAHAAVEDFARAVRERSRVFSHGNAALARDDSQIQALIGEQAASAFAVEATVVASADALEEAYRAALAWREAPGDERRAEAARRAAGFAEIRTAQAQSFATAAVQQLTSRLFDALAASATSTAKALDRHWRNARTVSSHNPVLFKNRWVGEWVLSDALPQPLWGIGVDATRAPATS